MGSCVSISVNIPLEQLFTVCCPQEEKKTITDLQNDWARLKAARDDISITIEDNLQMRPLEIVNQWLEQVAALEGRVDGLVIDSAQESITNKCFCSYFPRNCKKSYSLRKQVALMDQEVLNLQSQVPDVVVERPRVALALQVPTEPTTGMQSMLDEVWSHVVDEQDRHAGLIGLYGMGGVGKTTLLKAVYNRLCSSSHFDLKLWIVVSKSPNLVNIQNDIGEKIGFHGHEWTSKNQGQKAMEICDALRRKKYILLLDDIWERFDLTEIGIPLPDLQNKSKIIFTTRSKQVCRQMKARHIQVQCLKDEEAWILFKENVGEDALNARHDIPGLAKEVMKECSGLPLALIVIGRAMTCAETIQEWEHAIQVLKRYAADFSTITDEVFTPLKFSYDNLNIGIRSCFLYCSLYAEDDEILKSDLVDKWICEDYLGSKPDDLHNNRNKGHHYISTLVHASLLEECSSEKVKMHDVIRDMALWISGDSFYVPAQAGLTQIPNDVKWKRVEKLSLMNQSIRELNNGPTEFTKTETVLFRQAELKSINDFWKFVPYLKVLDLSYNHDLKSLPEELCELVFLQYLNLERTNIKELPNGFRKLVKIKYLNVRYTEVVIIPEGIFLSMKELSVFKCGGLYCYYADFLGENLVKEFESLKCLQDVTIPASSQVHISNLTSSMKLLNCITSLNLIGYYEYKWSTKSGLDILFLKEMKHIQNLHIEHVTRIKKIEVGEERQGLEISLMNNKNGGFNTIRSLLMHNCPQLKNLSWLVFCPNLERLEVNECWQMQTLLGDENEYRLDNGVEPFAKLRSLHLVQLPNLESICVTSLSFPCLNSLSLYFDIDKLKKLPFNSNSCNGGRGIVIEGTNEWWDELQWENEATRAAFSSSFQNIGRT